MPATLPRLPAWSWWLPLPLLHLGIWLSLPSQFIEGAALWHLPFALGLVFSLWWGPRALLAVYLNSALSIPLWGLDWRWAPLYALPETLAIGLAWLVCRGGFDAALSRLAHLLRFMLLGVLLPAALVAAGVQANLLLTGRLSAEYWIPASLILWLADSLIALAIAIPLLTYLTPALRRRGWALAPAGTARGPLSPALWRFPPWWLLLLLTLGLPWALGMLPPLLTLPLVGLAMFALALAWGLPGALCGAGLTTLITLALPLLEGFERGPDWLSPEQIELQFRVLILVVSSLLVGRSLSDLRLALAASTHMQQQLALAKLALEASPLGMTILDARDPALPLIYCNPAFTRISGYSAEEVRGRDWSFLLGSDLDQRELPRLRAALKHGQPCQAVLRNYRKNGNLFWNEITLAPMHDEQGISHYVALQHDVTAREQLALELEARRVELLRQTHLLTQTETIADLGGWVLELPSYRIFWSEGCYRIYELDPFAGAPSYEQALSYFDAESRSLVEQTIAHLLERDWAFDLELRLLSARGNARWVRVKGLAERDGDQVVRIYGAMQDITERKRAEEQLRQRDEWLRLFFEAPLIGMAMIGPQGQWLEVNFRLCQILGRSRQDLQGSSWPAITHPEDLAEEQPLFDALKAGQREDYELDKRFLRDDGSVIYTRLSLRAVRDAEGQLEACLALIEDITARREAEARYRTLVEHAPEAILVFGTELGIVEANENAARLFGLSRAELLGRMPTSFSPPLQPDGRPSREVGHAYARAALAGAAPVFEWLLRDQTGAEHPCEVRLVRLPGGDTPLLRLSITDISERQRYQREIERLAFSDELTGLPNRRLLLDRLQHAMAREQREGSYGALLFIDLDHFKNVNDSLGHPVGDALLREVTARLGSALRAEDTLARLGGDEFVVLLEALADTPEIAAEHAAAVGKKLLHNLLGSYRFGEHELAVSASIGISIHPVAGQDAADALKQADTAMYRAKQGGRNAVHFFAPEMQAAIDQRLQLQSELRQAIARDQLHLVFQPQLALASGEVVGAEVLLRWSHPERGDIPPGQFIPLAEETGLIEELGDWVLERACATLARWQAQWPSLVLAVNLSPRELRQAHCVSRIDACLRRHGLVPQRLELEITEGVLVEDVEQCIAAMGALKALGVRFAIDDFGTGYSSLTYLKRLPLDRLKIDRSFIHDLEHDANDQMLVETILLIARNLGLECIAEGIETPAQLDCLRRYGCALGQGYLFSRPLGEAAFERWLDGGQARLAEG